MQLVSVIIPTYNQGHLAAEAIGSVLLQSIGDFEIIVVDDGSTDNTAQIVKKFDDSRISYIYKENGGLASARNVGISNAKGKYIAFLDSDDLYTENYLQIMTSCLEENKDFGLAYSMFTNIYKDGQNKTGFTEERFLSGNLTRNFFERIPRILPSATVMKKEILNNFYFDENLRLIEDVDFFLRLSVRTKFLYVPEAVVKRRVLYNSLSWQAGKTISPNVVLILERFVEYLNNGLIPKGLARKKISRRYRYLAKEHKKQSNRRAAVELVKKAIFYYPYNLNYYVALMKALCMSIKKDNTPDWQMPKPLPPYITVNGKNMPFSV